MMILNFPIYSFRCRTQQGKSYIFCLTRKKFFLLRPEEWVRQHVLHYLIQDKKYPLISIKLELLFSFQGIKKRADIVVFRKEKPLILIECKSPYRALTKKTLQQISLYNLSLDCLYLMITNGIQHIFFQINEKNKKMDFLETLPKHPNFI